MEDGEQQAGVTTQGTNPGDEIEQIDPARAADVSRWASRIRAAKAYEPYKKAWSRMRDSLEIAKLGGSKEWSVNEDNYTVPNAMRHINKHVPDLSAKHPMATPNPTKPLDATQWVAPPHSHTKGVR